MPGIANDTVETFRLKVESFSAKYIADWDNWLGTDSPGRPAEMGRILRGWQACRPNRMRRDAASAAHQGPYLEDLLADAAPHVAALSAFDIAAPAPLDDAGFIAALDHLWPVFEQLSYHGKARAGLAGAVGISKSVMMASDGRVGPAFDRFVAKGLAVGKIDNAAQWRKALAAAHADIKAFERNNGISFADAKPPKFAHLHNGRVYDMALGPR